MITGESIPVEKGEGEMLIGATINQHSLLHMRATKVGADTVLANIIRLVEQAQGSKAPIQRLADKISSIFVPIILIIAVLTFIAWTLIGNLVGLSASEQMSHMVMVGTNPWITALVAAVAVLVVACPCALGLATPTAIMVGTGKGAEKGILIKGGESLERMQAVRAVLLDKTGTITRGKPELTDVIVLPGQRIEDILPLIAKAELDSDIPLATLLLRGKSTRLDVKCDSAVLYGTGWTRCRGDHQGHQVLVGTRLLLTERAVSFDALEEAMRNFGPNRQDDLWRPSMV